MLNQKHSIEKQSAGQKVLNEERKADAQYDMLWFLQWYARLIVWFAFCAPFIAIAWYCFSQFLVGAPEPDWWLQFEKQMSITW